MLKSRKWQSLGVETPHLAAAVRDGEDVLGRRRGKIGGEELDIMGLGGEM